MDLFDHRVPEDDDDAPDPVGGPNFFAEERTSPCGLRQNPRWGSGGLEDIDLNSQVSTFPNLDIYSDILRSWTVDL